MKLPDKRRLWLLALVPVALLIAAGAEREGTGNAASVAEVRAKPKVESAARADAEGLDLALAPRLAHAAEPGNAFESKSWYVPPPPPPPAPPAKPLPPPAPTAPPLPFTYLGQYQDNDKPVIFLIQGDRVLTVKQGDVIDGAYRVDGIVGTSLGLTYLPLNIKQILNIGKVG